MAGESLCVLGDACNPYTRRGVRLHLTVATIFYLRVHLNIHSVIGANNLFYFTEIYFAVYNRALNTYNRFIIIKRTCCEHVLSSVRTTAIKAAGSLKLCFI